MEPALLRADLLAAKDLIDEGWSNLIYSLPFINVCEELDSVFEIERNLGVANVPASVFVETPAAVGELTGFLDAVVHSVFIGAKDLTQTILSCDRSNARVAHLADPKSRPLLRAIRSVGSTNVPPAA